MVTEVMTTDMRTGGGSVRRSVSLSKPPVMGTDFDPIAFIAANAVAYWNWDDEGINQTDITGNGNGLSHSNGVDDPHYVAGKVGSAIDMLADGDVWSRPSTSDLQIGSFDFIVATWVRPDSVTDLGLLGKGPEYTVELNGLGKINFGVTLSTDGGVTPDDGVSVASGDTYTAAWTLIILRVNAADKAVSVRINNGTPTVQGYSSGSVPYVGPSDFVVGAEFEISGLLFDGLLDETLVLKTSETMAAEDFDALCSYLYAGGSGLDISFIFP